MHIEMQTYKQETSGRAAGACDSSEILAFNQRLIQDARSLLNETIIENRIHQAFQLKIHSQRIFWLTLARITERFVAMYRDIQEILYGNR